MTKIQSKFLSRQSKLKKSKLVHLKYCVTSVKNDATTKGYHLGLEVESTTLVRKDPGRVPRETKAFYLILDNNLISSPGQRPTTVSWLMHPWHVEPWMNCKRMMVGHETIFEQKNYVMIPFINKQLYLYKVLRTQFENVEFQTPTLKKSTLKLRHWILQH